MLKKLLRYEFKSVSKTLLPLFFGVFAASVFSSLFSTLNIRVFSADSGESFFQSILSLVSWTLFGLSLFAVFASIFIVYFILLHRYFKNFFGDEGYLTFTLPAKTQTHLWAKTISGIVWTALGILVACASGLILIVFGTGWKAPIADNPILNLLDQFFKLVFNVLGTSNAVLFLIEILFMVLASIASQMLMYYLAITLGSIIAKKRKVLASIGMYIVVNSVLSTLTSLVMIPARFIGVGHENTIDDFIATGHMYMLFSIIISIMIGGICFLVCNKMLETKLNLE